MPRTTDDAVQLAKDQLAKARTDLRRVLIAARETRRRQRDEIIAKRQLQVTQARIELAARHKQRRDAIVAAACEPGATLEEVGQRFGVSRERVRQIVLRAGVHAERKVIVRGAVQERQKQRSGAHAERVKTGAKERNEARHARRCRMIDDARKLRDRLGRVPTMRDLGAEFGYHASVIGKLFTGRTYVTKYANGSTRFYRLAFGCAAPTRGGRRD